jgi:hypothetical protein
LHFSLTGIRAGQVLEEKAEGTNSGAYVVIEMARL